MTTGRVDKLRRRCEHMLAAGEEILLEAEAWIKLGYLTLSGQGRAYLTGRRIIFVRRGLGLRWGFLPSWAPGVMTIQLSSIDHLRMVRDFTRAWLWIDAVGKIYYIRFGKGPYPLLRDNPRTTEEWLHAIEEGGGKHGPVIGAPVERSMASALLVAFVTLTVPFWLVGGAFVEMPLVFYIVLGVLTLVGLALGFFLLLRFPQGSGCPTDQRTR